MQFETDGGALGSARRQPGLGRAARTALWLEVDAADGSARLRPGGPRDRCGSGAATARRSSRRDPATLVARRGAPRDAARRPPAGLPRLLRRLRRRRLRGDPRRRRARRPAAASPTALRAARITEAVLASAPRAALGRRPRRPWRCRDEARVPHRLHARALARGDRRLGRRERLRGARAGGLARGSATARSPPATSTPTRFDAPRPSASCAALDDNGLTLSRARLLRQQPAPGPRRARGDPRPPARVHRRRRRARRRPGRHVRRPRPGPLASPRTCARPSSVFPPLVDYAGERGVKLMIENCVMEGWHPDGYPGNLAYSPELWEWMFALGLYLNFDPSHLLWLGHRPGRGARALRRPRRPRPRQGRRDLPRASATATASSAGIADARAGPVGHGLVALPHPRPRRGRLPRATSTRSTRAASTACSRSSTRTRSGAARRRRSSRACAIAQRHLRPLVGWRR